MEKNWLKKKKIRNSTSYLSFDKAEAGAPDSPLPGVLGVLAVARVRVGEVSGAAVLVADGILVDRSIGLGCAVVGRRDAITGFAAIVAVPVVHSAVRVLICNEVQNKRDLEMMSASPD